MDNNNHFKHILILELNNFKKPIFLDKNTYSIGRNSTNSIVIHHQLISRHHASLLKVTYKKPEKEDIVFWIVDGDLKGNYSTNGIYINGKRVLSHKLNPGDIILLGGSEVKAKYDIIDQNTNKFLSLIKENEQGTDIQETKEEVNQESLKNDNKSTLVAWNEIAKEPLKEQFIVKINSLQDLVNLPIIKIDLEGEIMQVNPIAEKQFPTLTEKKLEHPLLKHIKQIFQENKSILLIREIVINQDKFTQYIYGQEENKLIVSYILDYQKLQKLQLVIKEDEERYHSLVKQISEGIFLVDPISKKILYANQAYCDLLGYSLEEILQLTIYDLVGIDKDILQKDLEEITTEKIAFIRESIHKRKNNTFINVEVSVSFIVYEAKEVICCTVRDITERKKSQEILRYQSFHNPLTTLPNEKLFYQQLKTSLYNVKNTDKILALIFIKLKDLEKINYTFGHNQGDELIQNVVKRIKSCLRPLDILADWKGNKFIALLPEIEHINEVNNISKKILKSMQKPFIANNDYRVNININLGISLCPQDGKDTATLLRKADAALDYTEDKLGNTYHFYSPEIINKIKDNLQLENLLNLAIEKEKFEVLYQPVINVKTGEIIEFEAKIKWQDSEYREIQWEEFLPIAHKNGLIVPLNYWLIKNACKQNKIWQKKNLPPLKIKTQLYSLCWQDQNLLTQLKDILETTKLDPNFLNLVIQPGNFKQIWESSPSILMNLLNMGINISLDDFGSGDTSLIYLKEFPFHKLQLTSSLLKNLDQKADNLTIISTILTLAMNLNLSVIAKGVNSFEQMELLANLQCEQMQGELISDFLNEEMATDFLSGKQENLTEVVNNKTIFKMSNIPRPC